MHTRIQKKKGIFMNRKYDAKRVNKFNLILILIFSVVISAFMLNNGQTINYIAEEDEVIEWQSYNGKELA